MYRWRRWGLNVPEVIDPPQWPSREWDQDAPLAVRCGQSLELQSPELCVISIPINSRPNPKPSTPHCSLELMHKAHINKGTLDSESAGETDFCLLKMSLELTLTRWSALYGPKTILSAAQTTSCSAVKRMATGDPWAHPAFEQGFTSNAECPRIEPHKDQHNS